jgi:hypothetical protein
MKSSGPCPGHEPTPCIAARVPPPSAHATQAGAARWNRSLLPARALANRDDRLHSSSDSLQSQLRCPAPAAAGPYSSAHTRHRPQSGASNLASARCRVKHGSSKREPRQPYAGPAVPGAGPTHSPLSVARQTALLTSPGESLVSPPSPPPPFPPRAAGRSPVSREERGCSSSLLRVAPGSWAQRRLQTLNPRFAGAQRSIRLQDEGRR